MDDFLAHIKRYISSLSAGLSLRFSDILLPLFLLLGINSIYLSGWISLVPQEFRILIDTSLYAKTLLELNFFIITTSLIFRILTFFPLATLHGGDPSEEDMRWKSSINKRLAVLSPIFATIYFVGLSAALLEFVSTALVAAGLAVAYILLNVPNFMRVLAQLGIDPTVHFDPDEEAQIAKRASLIKQSFVVTTSVILVCLCAFDLGAARARSAMLNPMVQLSHPVEGHQKLVIFAHTSGGFILFEPRTEEFYFSKVGGFESLSMNSNTEASTD